MRKPATYLILVIIMLASGRAEAQAPTQQTTPRRRPVPRVGQPPDQRARPIKRVIRTETKSAPGKNVPPVPVEVDVDPAAAEAAAPEAVIEKAGDDDIVEMHGVDRLDILLSFVQKMTNRVILYDTSIKTTKVKIFGTARIPRKDLLRFVETVLEMNGCTMTEAPGNVLRVVPIKNVLEPIAVRVGNAGELPDTSEMITQIVKLKYADPMKINTLVRAMVTPRDGKVSIYEDLSMIFITDASHKIKKILAVIEQLDQPAPKIILETVSVEHAAAAEVAKTLSTLMQKKAAREKTGRKGLAMAYIHADPRSSSIIMMGLEHEIADIKRVLEVLDRPLAEKEGLFHSYQLKNTSATDLAKVLVELYQKKAAAQRAGGARPGTQGTRGREPSIVPEPNTNSLLIIAPPDVYQEMETLIAKLDVRRPQVLIEVMLVEVSFDQTTDAGIEFAYAEEPKRGESTVFGGTGFDLGFDISKIVSAEGMPFQPTSLGTGLFAGMFRGTKYIPLILRAWETAGNVEVLAVPRLLTNDNSTATISIGDQVPFQRQIIQRDFTNITWDNATAQMRLEITPHISEADHLRLDLDFMVERFGPQFDTAAPPPKSTRNTTTKVTIPNEHTIIIGGLTHTSVRDSETRVPLLYKIPILGRMFKKTTKVRTKTHLFIFITPHILRGETFEDLAKISNKVEIEMGKVRKKGDWRSEVGVWGLGDEAAPTTLPEIIPVDVETKIKEEKDAGKPDNALEIGQKRPRSRR